MIHYYNSERKRFNATFENFRADFEIACPTYADKLLKSYE